MVSYKPKLPTATIRNLIQVAIEDSNMRIGAGATVVMQNKMADFCTALSKLAVEEAKLEGRITVLERHILRALDSRANILKVYPRVLPEDYNIAIQTPNSKDNEELERNPPKEVSTHGGWGRK